MIYTLAGGTGGLLGYFLAKRTAYSFDGRRWNFFPGEGFVIVFLFGLSGSMVGFGYGTKSIVERNHILQKIKWI